VPGSPGTSKPRGTASAGSRSRGSRDGQGGPAGTCGSERHRSCGANGSRRAGAPSPRARRGAGRGEGQVCSAWPARGSLGAPVAVVIAVRVAHGERQAGLALRVLLVTLLRGTVLEEVGDIADLEKTNRKQGFGDPSCRLSRSQQQPGRALGRTGDTHDEDGNESPLEQPCQHITPVVLVVGHSGVAHVDGEGDEEELDGGAQQPGPLPHQPGLHVELGREGGGSDHPVQGAQGGVLGAPVCPGLGPTGAHRLPAAQHAQSTALTARNIMQYIPKEECPE